MLMICFLRVYGILRGHQRFGEPGTYWPCWSFRCRERSFGSHGELSLCCCSILGVRASRYEFNPGFAPGPKGQRTFMVHPLLLNNVMGLRTKCLIPTKCIIMFSLSRWSLEQRWWQHVSNNQDGNGCGGAAVAAEQYTSKHVCNFILSPFVM